MRFSIETLGCKVNQVESRDVAGILLSRGHIETVAGKGCDVCIVNTCAVTAESGRKSRQTVRRIKKLEPDAKLVVCGCFSQISPEDAVSLGADLVSGSGGRARLADDIERIVSFGGSSVTVDDAMARREFELLPVSGTGQRTRAMLKIQDGCDNFCAYCVIPYARGPARSIPLEAAAAKARRLADMGYLEIVITGIEISSYGKDLADTSLADAIHAIADAAPGVRLRIGSLDPGCVSNDLIARLSDFSSVCKHFHLSLQSGCDDTLLRMGRRYDTATVMQTITELRRAFPECGISADLITGFPGETDAEFDKTLAFIKSAAFSRMHIFPFSERPGTPAASMPMQVEKRVRSERAKRAGIIADCLAGKFCEGMLGKTVNVLFESERGGLSYGHAENYVEVICGRSGLHNMILPVKITEVRDGLTKGIPE